MFKPVRVVATIIFLAMIVMIFVSAFVLNSGTLSISKPSPPSSSSRFPYARTRSSLRRPRVPRIPMVHAVVYSVRALRSSQGIRHVIILGPCNHPYLALVLATVRQCCYEYLFDEIFVWVAQSPIYNVLRSSIIRKYHAIYSHRLLRITQERGQRTRHPHASYSTPRTDYQQRLRSSFEVVL